MSHMYQFQTAGGDQTQRHISVRKKDIVGVEACARSTGSSPTIYIYMASEVLANGRTLRLVFKTDEALWEVEEEILSQLRDPDDSSFIKGNFTLEIYNT